MAKLTAKTRDALPAQDFAGPDRSYPVNDMSHAQNALARVSQFGTDALKKAVSAKVHKKFPSLKMDGGSVKARGDRPCRK